MKMKSNVLALITMAILLGSVAVSDAMGYWQTESQKVPIKFEEGEFAGQSNPADIRGSFSFGDISEAFDIPVELMAEAFGIEAAAASDFQVKTLETRYAALAESGQEIGTSSVRYFVALYKGLPFELTEPLFLPETAVALLITTGDFDTEEMENLKSIAVTLPAPAGITEQTIEKSEVEGNTSGDGFVIKGKTTFGELLDAGVSQSEIEKILGGSMPSRLTAIKTYCTEQGLTFEEIKLELEALVE
jgi:hypothetical protein